LRKPLNRIAVLGNYLPRHCGIATFTVDLARTLTEVEPNLMVDVIAMSDKSGYIYPECVKFEIREGERADYRSAAEFINRNGYDLLSVQHEYGIFGGKSGIYLMDLVREAKMPIVTTLHTVLQEPSVEQKAVLDELLQLSERVVVMSQKAVEFLTDVHEVPLNKIDLIHHGIPSVSQTSASSFRASLGIVGPMILTFGLLSPDKGIQYVIEAMPLCRSSLAQST
jgi:glycosyltransferase involved in cell wall biosynthesis